MSTRKRRPLTVRQVGAFCANQRHLQRRREHRAPLRWGWPLEHAVRLASAGMAVTDAIRACRDEPHLKLRQGYTVGTQAAAPPGTFAPRQFHDCLEDALRYATVGAAPVAHALVAALGGPGADVACEPPVTVPELVRLLVACARYALDPAAVARVLNRIGADRRAAARERGKHYRTVPKRVI